MKISILFSFFYLFCSLSQAHSLQPDLQESTPYSIKLEHSFKKTSLYGEIVTKEKSAWKHSVLITLKRNGKDVGSCSGTIIAKDTILTAGHCLSDGVDGASIYFGRENANKKTEYVDIRTSDKLEPYRYRESSAAMNVPSKTETNSEPYLGFNEYQFNAFIDYFDGLADLVVSNRYDDGFDKISREDIALIFFKGGLPKGFESAKWYSGKIPGLKETVYTYGYGLNSRKINETDYNLREAKTQVYKYYVTQDGTPIFFRAFSGGHSSSNPCAGDSGGGTYFRDSQTGELKLIAIVIDSVNGCANSQGHNMIQQYGKWVEDRIADYRSRISI